MTCDICGRELAKVVIDEMMPPNQYAGMKEPWRFTYKLCRWHRASWKRKGWLKADPQEAK